MWQRPLNMNGTPENEEAGDAHGLKSVTIRSDRKPIDKLIIPGSQATEEYLQASIFQTSQVTVGLTVYSEDFANGLIKEAPETWNAKPICTADAVKLIQAATHLNVCSYAIDIVGAQWESERLHGLLGALLDTPYAVNPSLETIRLVAHMISREGIPADPGSLYEEGHDWARRDHDPEFVPFLLPMYGFHMPIAQQAELYRLKLSKAPLRSGDLPPVKFARVKTLAALFVKNERGNASRLWTEEEVFDSLPSRNILKASQFEWYAQLERRVRHWTDSRIDIKNR